MRQKNFGFSGKELRMLKGLDTPRKIQDFIDGLEPNYDKGKDTCMSPRAVLRKRKAHCVEAAMLAAAALRVNGQKPLVLDMTTSGCDEDHVVAVFRRGGHWGAVSKSNHAILRYRDPIFRDIRELVMSYFNEYFMHDGRKTLRSYSMPVDLSRFDRISWMTSDRDVWEVPNYLADVRHINILSSSQLRSLRKADPIEVKMMGLLVSKKK